MFIVYQTFKSKKEAQDAYNLLSDSEHYFKKSVNAPNMYKINDNKDLIIKAKKFYLMQQD